MADTYNADDEVEQVKNWFKENGMSLVAGLAVGLGIVVGWQSWQSYTEHQSQEASHRYGQLQQAVRSSDLSTAEDYLKELQDDYKGTPYAALGSMQLAGGYARANQLPQADVHLQWVVDYADDNKIRNLARLRRARLLWAQGESEAALELLEKAKVSEAMQPMFADLKGDLLLALGRKGEARDAYQVALAGYAVPAEQALVEQKLDDLTTAEVAAETPQAADVEESEAAEETAENAANEATDETAAEESSSDDESQDAEEGA